MVQSSEIGDFEKWVKLYKTDIVVIEATERVVGPELDYYNDSVIDNGL